MSYNFDDFAPDNTNDEEYLEEELEDLEEETEVDLEKEEEEDDFKETYETLIENKERQTIPFLTKYEKARVLGIRARQLSSGATPLVEVGNLELPKEIANKELIERKLTFIIRRPLPNGKYEDWRLDELRLD